MSVHLVCKMLITVALALKFVGMWEDREDMHDSNQWVRQARQQEWTS